MEKWEIKIPEIEYLTERVHQGFLKTSKSCSGYMTNSADILIFYS